jgi:hypothetical protein
VLSDAERRARREELRRQIQRRRLVALGALAAIAVLVVVAVSALGGGGDGAGGTPAAAAKPDAPPELPTGGRSIFPEHRVVAYYGAPQDEELGVLGIGSPDRAVRRLERQAAAYERDGRPVLLALELISTIVTADAGGDGLHRTHQTDAVIRRYLRAARRAKALLILDIQPGRADFFSEARRLEKWLRKPDVGIALDPEWRMAEGETPGQVIGSVESREVNATSAWVASIVERHDLPEKLFLVHQFTSGMVENKHRIQERPGLEITFNVDGFGDHANKLSKWDLFTRQKPRLNDGYKLFYKEDLDLMTPREVMRMKPRPDLIVYE